MVGRFAIRSRLGAGGMGEVYRAEDTRLKRPVALKRIAPQLRADESYRRYFVKEAERASALIDPHIASVYDVLEENGETFLVMEYVEGQTLRQRLEKPLDLKEFLPLVVQCAEALVAAHEKGIVHRDIKPENLMVTPKGQLKILDFGVAKRVPRTDETTAAASTASTAAPFAGTPAYMAPEALLEKKIDGRADIFSLGVILYEVLAGRHPFRADTFTATSDRILHAVPTLLSKHNPEVPAELERIVAKMLAKDPAERYATARDLLVDLRAVQRAILYPPLQVTFPPQRAKRRRALIAAGLAVVVLLVGIAVVPAIYQPLLRWVGLSPIPEQKNVAVLAFTAIGGGPEDQVYCNGLTATVTATLTQLTRRRTLQVVPASEVQAQQVSTLEQARKKLGANLVLGATWQRSGEKVRINLVLTDARTTRQLRTATITEDARDVFALQDSVVAAALRMLEVEVPPEEARQLAAHGTTVLTAYDFYLQGLGYLQRYERPENVDAAITLFQRALEKDASYALAHAALGEAYWKKYESTKATEWVDAARQGCERAMVLDASLAAPHICLGTLHNGTGEYEQAVAEFRRALVNEPTSDNAYRGLALAQERLGQLEEAERTYRRAIKLRPAYWASYNWLGTFYYVQGRYQEAAAAFGRVVELTPDNARGYTNLGGMYHMLGRADEAIAAFQKSLEIQPTAPAYSNIGTVEFFRQNYTEAARAFEKATELWPDRYFYWGNLGDAYYFAPDEREKAQDAYQRALTLAEEELRVNPRNAEVCADLARYHAKSGQLEQALVALRRAQALAPEDVNVIFQAAIVFNLAGQPDRSLALLKKAVEQGYSKTEIRNHPEFQVLRVRPEFQKFVTE
jgi:serine/threonine-protein kinase